MINDVSQGMLFVTTIANEEEQKQVQMLTDSIRTFGGPFRESEVWIFDISPEGDLCVRMGADRVEAFPLELPSGMASYPFAGKVTACASAEEMVAAADLTLVWVSNDCLVLNPPNEQVLTLPYQAAFRPVHIQNVGSAWVEPLDAYWQTVYEVVKLEKAPFSVTSFVDQVRLRPYFNSHTFSIHPSLGLMNRWLELFQQFVTDEEFQEGPCQPIREKVFLHQALLSALVVSELGEEEIWILPPKYSYPYNLHGDIPATDRVGDMGALVNLTWEGRTLDPRQVEDLHIGEPYRSWLRGFFE
jgi:hypothetical protein